MRQSIQSAPRAIGIFNLHNIIPIEIQRVVILFAGDIAPLGIDILVRPIVDFTQMDIADGRHRIETETHIMQIRHCARRRYLIVTRIGSTDIVSMAFYNRKLLFREKETLFFRQIRRPNPMITIGGKFYHTVFGFQRFLLGTRVK